jgi:ubiquitin C-terminal hydrolase
VSLNYCITNYSKGEKLAGRDKFKCDKCGELVEAMKSTQIKTLPNFLSVHLRRFKYDEYKRGITKLIWQIPFPFKLRVATTYSSKPNSDSMYKLVGVVVHLGTGENYGHYISYIKIGQKWFVFNDDEISETDCYLLESLWGYKGLSKCAYMLFYSI